MFGEEVVIQLRIRNRPFPLETGGITEKIRWVDGG